MQHIWFNVVCLIVELGQGVRMNTILRFLAKHKRWLMALPLLTIPVLIVVDSWLPYMLLSHHNLDVNPKPAIFADYQVEPQSFLSMTSDSVEIAGWYIEADSSANHPTIIVLHTLGRTREDMLHFTMPLLHHGFNLVYLDMRSHGESGGEFFTYGYHEWRDVSSVVDYLEARGDQYQDSIFVLGASAGSAVAISAAARDHRLAGLVTIAAFADLESMISYQAAILPAFWRQRTIRKAEGIANFSIEETAAFKLIREVNCPVFLAHGTADWYVPFSSAETLYANVSSTKQLYRIEGAGHASMFSAGGAELRHAIVEFLKNTPNSSVFGAAGK